METNVKANANVKYDQRVFILAEKELGGRNSESQDEAPAKHIRSLHDKSVDELGCRG